MRLIPKKWDTFQHYKDRNPPWIKLHKYILDDRDYMRLPVASRALAPLLWLLASESKDGSFDADVEELIFRLRLSKKEIVDGLKPLILKGFLLDATTMLAPRLQDAVPETEGEAEEEAEREGEAPQKVVSIAPKEKPARAARATQLPDDFQISESGIKYAQMKYVDWKTEIDAFKNYHTANGTTMKNWDAGWRTWCDRAAKFNKAKINQPQQPLTHQQATKLAASRTIFGDERSLANDPRTIDVTTPQIAG